MPKIKIEGVAQTLKVVDPKELKEAAKEGLKAFGRAAVTSAKLKAPVNNGILRSQIAADTANLDALEISILSNAKYGGYLEFGTRKFAAQYVPSLDQDWQELAKQLQGASEGTFEEFLASIVQWVHDKGLAGTYSVKTKKRTGNKGKYKAEDLKVAWPIAMKILRVGIKPQPYLYPAIEENKKIVEETIRKYYD